MTVYFIFFLNNVLDLSVCGSLAETNYIHNWLCGCVQKCFFFHTREDVLVLLELPGMSFPSLFQPYNNDLTKICNFLSSPFSAL